MKIYELLSEQINVDDLTNEILTNCSPFLKQIDYNILQYPLYRGFMMDSTQVNDNLITIPGFRNDRKPVDTPSEVHKMINAAFIKQFHFPFRNGTFVCSNFKDARAYGNVSMILPKGDFHFLWSPDAKDLYQKYRSFRRNYLETEGAHVGYGDIVVKKFIEAMNNNDFNYRNDNLKAAIQSGHEIMLYCDECYKISPRSEIIAAVIKNITTKGAK